MKISYYEMDFYPIKAVKDINMGSGDCFEVINTLLEGVQIGTQVRYPAKIHKTTIDYKER